MCATRARPQGSQTREEAKTRKVWTFVDLKALGTRMLLGLEGSLELKAHQKQGLFRVEGSSNHGCRIEEKPKKGRKKNRRDHDEEDKEEEEERKDDINLL